ncbi:MAG: PEP-CTERM sorting domain-containing protein [Opitutales bacterium]|jgi:hypothetical protein
MKTSANFCSKSLSAATLASLMLASSTEAVVINNTTSVTVGYFQPNYPWDIDGSNGSEINVATASLAYINLRSAANSFAAVASGIKLLNLATSQILGPEAGLNYLGQFNKVLSYGVIRNAQGFTNGNAGYMGFKFDHAGTTCYGWAEIVLAHGSFSGTFTINQWAYEDSGAAIQVGSTVPEPASTAAGLGLLALGAAGLRKWRKDKAAKAA